MDVDRTKGTTMQWLNEPAQWAAENSRVTLTADARTDFWRKTHDGGIRDSGHFYFDTVAGDFTAQVKMTGEYRSQYDQAGLMVRVDETTWLKCGIEFLEGRQHASAVVTRECSDWSLTPIPNPTSLWILCERRGATFSVRYSLDGNEYEPLRQAFLSQQHSLQVGMMIAAPKGNGFTVLFEDYLVAFS